MREQQARYAAAPLAAMMDDAPAAGRQTLAEETYAQEPEPEVPVWEDIDPAEHESAMAAQPEQQEAEPEILARDLDDEADEAQDEAHEPKAHASAATAGGSAPAAHAAKAHHADHHHAKPYYARTDKFNRKQGRGRPQVTTFVIHSDLQRFVIRSGAAAAKYDSVKSGVKLTINVAHVRSLRLDGATEPVECVLTRTVNEGAAWARLADVKNTPAAQDKLAHAVEKSARAHAPAAPAMKAMAHHGMKFKVSGPTHSGFALTGHLSSQSKSNLDHYLERPSHSADAPKGSYNICLNLPQPGTPPVQVDIALPGDHFFVATTREVAVYQMHHEKAAKKIKWAFGCVGVHRNGKWVPDRARRGWVPLQTLEKA